MPERPVAVPSSNPLTREFWLGEVDARPLALFRIALGLTVLHDLANYAAELTAFASDAGMLPRGVQGDATAWSLFDLVGSPHAVAALFAAGCLAVLASTAGLYTRVTTLLSWVFLTSLHHRNLYVTDGGDDLVRNLFFLSLFTNTGGVWSLDSWRGKRRPWVPALGLRALQVHLALLYFVAGRLKFRAHWLSAGGIYETLQLPGFVRPPGQLLLAWPGLCRALSVVTVGLEWSFAFGAFSPWRIRPCRAWALFAGLAVQLGILVTLRVGIFTEAMIAATALFVLPEWLDALGSRPAQVPSEPAAQTRPLVRRLAATVLAIHFIGLAWGPFIGSHLREPSPTRIERTWLALEQPMGLFDNVYDVPTWSVAGVDVEGKPVADVLAVAQPNLVPRVGWSFSRWYKFTFKERERPFRWPQLGAYLCRSYAARGGAALRSLSIVETLTPPTPPSGRVRSGVSRERWRGDCPLDSATN